MNYLEARSEITKGKTLRRASWAQCRKVRRWEESDGDSMGLASPYVFVEDCPKACDCAVGPYIETSEDIKAEDWEYWTSLQDVASAGNETSFPGSEVMNAE